jgi:uncharacterized protein YxjI
MDQLPTIEDSRGVDVSQIRRQLRMSVEDRVRHMVEVTNKLMEVRATVRLLIEPDQPVEASEGLIADLNRV